METVPCNLCGSDRAFPLLTGRDRQFDVGDSFSVSKCTKCGLVRVVPRPDEQEIGAHYLPEYHSAITTGHQLQIEATGGLEQFAFNMIFKRRTPPFVPGGRALDIGCAGGAYLVALRNLGWDVHGVELDQEAARLARERLGLDVRGGSADAVLKTFPDAYFDVVTMWHVLEHVFDPAKLLTEIRRILKPGGRFMFEVPNFNSLSRHLFRTYWFPLDLPRHLYHFDARTLEAMLTQAGFVSVQIKGVPAALAATLSLQLVANRLNGTPRGGSVAFNRPLLIGLFPFSLLLARFNWSAHMAGEARKSP